MQVERVDFITIPTLDVERSRSWYRETLGLPLDPNDPEELAAGQVTLTFCEPEEEGIEISQAPSEIRVEPLDQAHERLGELIGWDDDKFAAHNAAVWEHGLLVHIPGGLELERPLYVRVVNAIDGGSLFWRLLVIAEEGSRFSLVEEYASASAGLPGYFNGVAELFVEQSAKLEYVSLQNLSRETWHFASHHARVERDAELDWVSGGFGSKKGKVRIQNDLAGQGATSRVTGASFADGAQHLDYDTV